MVRAAFAVGLAVISACAYEPMDPDQTVFKCDQQKTECPEGYFCSNIPSGVCVQQSVTGCRDQRLSRYWGFDLVDGSEDQWSKWADQSLAMSLRGTFNNTVSAEVKYVGDGSLRVEMVPVGAPDPVARRRGWMAPMNSNGDMTGKIFSARVWSETPGVAIKGYVEAPNTVWNGGPNFPINLGEWKCASLELDHPPSNDPGYSPLAVTRVGFEIVGPLPMVFYLDDVGY